MPSNVLAQQAASIESTIEYKTFFGPSLPLSGSFIQAFVIPRAEEYGATAIDNKRNCNEPLLVCDDTFSKIWCHAPIRLTKIF